MSLAIRDYHPAMVQKQDFWQKLGIPPRGDSLYTALRNGLPYEIFERLAQYTDLNRSTLAEHLGIAPATLQRRLKVRQFNSEESDRLFRLAAVYKATLDLFETIPKPLASGWPTRYMDWAIVALWICLPHLPKPRPCST